MQGVSSVHWIDVSLVQRRLWKSVGSVLGIGPLTLQTPHGRCVAAQPSATVTTALPTTGVRCEMPVQPTSSTVAGLLASSAKCTVVGHAQLQPTHAKSSPQTVSGRSGDPGSQNSPGSSTPLPHAGPV